MVDKTLYMQKQGFDAIDSTDVLSRVARLPISGWAYKVKPAERHIGPMAQDFHTAFGLGGGDEHIDMLEAQLQALRQTVDAWLAALERSSMAPTSVIASAAVRP